MRLKRYFTVLLSLSLIILIFNSCKKGEKKQIPPKANIIQSNKGPELKVFPVPTPYEVTDVITKAGISFDQDILNPISNSKKYLTTQAQALNIGVYGTDLSYANVFNNGLLVREYFDAIKSLSDELGLTLLFTDDFLQRIDNNINNTDSLYKIATESYYKTYSYLVDRGKSDVASVVLTGSFVEALYLALKAAETLKDPTIIYQKVAEQKFASQQLVSLLDKDASLSDMAQNVLTLIRPIDAILRQVRYINDKPVINQKSIELLRTAVYHTRQRIVNME